jgi:hypothetical protein
MDEWNKTTLFFGEEYACFARKRVRACHRAFIHGTTTSLFLRASALPHVLTRSSELSVVDELFGLQLQSAL